MKTLSMRKIILISVSSFFIPFAIFLVVYNSPLAEIFYQSIIVHSILFAVICSIAFSSMYFFYSNYVKNKNTRDFILSLFFCITGFVMLFHALTIPGFYFFNEKIFDVTEHYGLFIGSLLLLLLLLPNNLIEKVTRDKSSKTDTATPIANRFSVLIYQNKVVILSILSLISVYIFVALFRLPGLLDSLFLAVNPITFLTAAFILLANLFFFMKEYLVTKDKMIFYIIISLSILINAAIIPLFYEEWDITWWYFHLILLFGFVVILVGIFKSQR